MLTVSLWLAAAFPPARAGENAPGRQAFAPQARVTLDVWGGTLNEAISQIAKQTRVMPLVSREVNRGGASRQKIFVTGRDMPLPQAVEWLAHAVGCRYRLTAGEIRLTAGYEWVRRRRYGMFLRQVETLVGIRHDSERPEKIAEFQRFLDEMMKAVTLFDPQTDHYQPPRLEEHEGGQIKLNANVPEELKPLFEKALVSLETPGMPAGAPGRPAVPPETLRLINKLSNTTVVAAYRSQPLRQVLDDLRAQSGLNIGIDNSALPQTGDPAPVTLQLGNVNIQEALIALARALGLRGAALSPPNGVWLTRGKCDWETLPTRRTLWADDMEVKVYRLSSLPGKVDGEALAHWLRLRVRPAVWLDPLASVLFHAPSGNLLVIAPPEAQEAVRLALPRAGEIPELRAE